MPILVKNIADLMIIFHFRPYTVQVRRFLGHSLTWGDFDAKLKVILFSSWVKGHDMGSHHVGWLYEEYWLSIKVLLPRV